MSNDNQGTQENKTWTQNPRRMFYATVVCAILSVKAEGVIFFGDLVLTAIFAWLFIDGLIKELKEV